MKKIILIITIILFSNISIAFARVTEDPVTYGANPQNYNQPSNNYFLYSPKSEKILTTDVRDLQTQIDQLNQKNIELELKLKQQPLIQQVPTQITTPQASPNDASQTQRIDTLEKRMSILEKTLQNVSGAISNTIDLIKKLLAKL